MARVKKKSDSNKIFSYFFNIRLEILFRLFPNTNYYSKIMYALIFLLQGGIYVLQIIDWYCASFSLMLISFTECLAISWVYGEFIFCDNP